MRTRPIGKGAHRAHTNFPFGLMLFDNSELTSSIAATL